MKEKVCSPCTKQLVSFGGLDIFFAYLFLFSSRRQHCAQLGLTAVILALGLRRTVKVDWCPCILEVIRAACCSGQKIW